MDTHSFIINIKAGDVYKDIADDVEKRFGTLDNEINRPLPIVKNKKVIGLMKDELGGKIMIESAALGPKTYSCLMDDCNSTIKKAKGTKKGVIKKIRKFNDCKNCLLTNNDNEMIISCNYDKRLQTFDRVTSYNYGSSVGKVCKTEILSKFK